MALLKRLSLLVSRLAVVGKVSRLQKNPLIEIGKTRVTVGVLEGDHSLVFVAALASTRTFHEPFDLADSVPTMVPTLAAATFDIVLKIALEGASQRSHRGGLD